MAPQKGGGQANKQKQQQQQNAKKSNTAAAARPAVVPAIPLPFMLRQASQASRQTQQPTIPRSPGAPLVVSSNGHSDPVPSLEAALIDHPNVALRKRMTSASGSDITLNGSNAEKPGSTATINGTHERKTSSNTHTYARKHPQNREQIHQQKQVNPSHYRNFPNGTTTNGPYNVTKQSPVSVNGYTNGAVEGLAQIMIGSDSSHGMGNGMSNVSSGQSTTAPSVAGDSNDYAYSLPYQNGHHPNGHHQPVMRPQFGVMGFPDSHTPSPAPPSAGFMPPPPLPPNHANGQHPEMMPMSSMDNYHGIPASVHHMTPFDGYSPSANGHGRSYGPPTPRSFHGSNASGETYHPHHPQPGAHHAQFAPYMPLQLPFTRRPSIMENGLMENVVYFQSHFNAPELADCALVLELAPHGDTPGTSVKIDGHKLILAQSPALKHHIMDARAAEPGIHTFSIQSDDSYLRSDAWYTAVQRLYLHPLFSLPPMMGNNSLGMDFVGSNGDQFKFCLGYAAAGYLLQMEDVLVRGLGIAAEMINWGTVEEGLSFALDGATHRHLTYNTERDGSDRVDVEFSYGPHTKILMASITDFLINAFPHDFELDTTVSDPHKFARIPPVPVTLPSPRPDKFAPPAIARGSSVRKASSKPGRLPSIKFGDLPTAFPEDEPSTPREPARCSPQLSRILLNLPFDDLQYVLTSESIGVSGWNTAQDRYHAVIGVVGEREARRIRAVEAVREGKVPGWKEIQHRLSAPRRYAIVEVWDVLNWQEEVAQPSGAGVPGIIRHWVPQFDVQTESEPTPRVEAQPSQSMV